MISEKIKNFQKSKSCSMDVAEAGLYGTLGGRTKLNLSSGILSLILQK